MSAAPAWCWCGSVRQRQGRRLHDAGGRNRHRQYRGMPKVMERFRKEVMGARLILVEGYIQSSPEQ